MNYNPTPTAKKLHDSDNYFRVLIGPIACGKTTAMVMDLFMNPPDSKYPVLFVTESPSGFLDELLPTIRAWFGDMVQYSHLGRNGVIPITGCDDIRFRHLDYKNYNESTIKHKSERFSRVLISNGYGYGCPCSLVKDLACITYADKRAIIMEDSGFGVVKKLKKYDIVGSQFEFIYPSSHLLADNGIDFIVNPDAENIDNLPEGYYDRLLKCGCIDSEVRRFINCKAVPSFVMIGE